MVSTREEKERERERARKINRDREIQRERESGMNIERDGERKREIEREDGTESVRRVFVLFLHVRPHSPLQGLDLPPYTCASPTQRYQ